MSNRGHCQQFDALLRLPSAGMNRRDVSSAPQRLRAQPSWLVNQVALSARRLVSDGLARAGTHRYQYSLLAAANELGSASQAELSRRTTIDRSDVVAIVNELAESGYLERSPDPTDRRRNIITVTASGRRRLQKLDRVLAQLQDELLAPLGPDERTHLIALLTRIVDHHTEQ